MSGSGTLPSTVRAILERGDRKGNTLGPRECHQIATLLCETGIHGAANLGWMANLIRFRLGVGERPTPPGSLQRQDYALQLAEQRAETIARELLDERKAAA